VLHRQLFDIVTALQSFFVCLNRDLLFWPGLMVHKSQLSLCPSKYLSHVRRSRAHYIK